MGMRNSEYWQERFVQLENALYSKREEAAAEIEAAYRQAQRDIEAAIDKWYGRIAVNNGISKAEAMKLLSANQLKEFHWDVWEYIRRGEENAVNQKWMKELENASAKFHISRLEALKLETENSLQLLFAKQREISERTITEGYEEGYYHTAFELQKGFNIGFDVAKTDRNYLEKVIAKPWAADGRNFSERIWGNRVKLVNELHSDIIRSLSAGTGTQRVIDNIAKKMNVQKNHAQALVLTEGAFFSTVAEKDCYGDFDVENYEILATLDDRTSDICQTMDGKVFPVKDMQPGVTAPPFHVRCRSTTVPFFDDDFGLKGSRAARDENGQTYYVPDDMKYPEWKKTFVEGGSKEGLEKTTQKGGSTVYKRVDKTGGSGIIKERKPLKINMQYFAEKDIENQESNSLKRAMRKYQKRIAEHNDKINNPEKYIPDWNNYDELKKQGLKNHWQKEISNFEESIENRIEELKKRGDYDE